MSSGPPRGWDEVRIQDVRAHYKGQSEDEAEDEVAADRRDQTTVQVPVDLLPAVRAVLNRHSAGG